MSTGFDFSPLFRSSVGFDRIFEVLEKASQVGATDAWPPYDIVKLGDDDYRVTLAVAGFSQNELTVTYKPNLLLVTGEKAGEDKAHYLHRGLMSRSFQRRFELADHVKVVGARLENGLLTIDLRHEIPEEMKPRRIEIGHGAAMPGAAARLVESRKQAA